MTANLEAAAKAIPPGSACSAADRLPVTTSSIGLDVYDFEYEFRQRSDVTILLEGSFGSNSTSSGTEPHSRLTRKAHHTGTVDRSIGWLRVTTTEMLDDET